MTVVGIDGWKAGWLGVVLEDTDVRLHFEESLASFVERFSGADAIVVDVPIGFPVDGRRLADQEARRMVGPRASSVFSTPPVAPLHAPSYQDALKLCRDQYGFGLSSQSYSLREKIFEAVDLVEGGASLIEGHPEVSFGALKGGHLEFAKRTWNGPDVSLVDVSTGSSSLNESRPDGSSRVLHLLASRLVLQRVSQPEVVVCIQLVGG